MLEEGIYVHKFPARKARGFRYNALHTPLGWINSWAYIAQKFLEAASEFKKGNIEKMKTWLNSFMSEPYEEKGQEVEWVKLQARSEPQHRVLTVPRKGYFLTAGVDTQDDRLAVKIKAWGRGEESWLVYWGELIGDPEYREVWDELDILLNQAYRHESGAQLLIDCMAIDSQGHRTNAVYNFCRTRFSRGVIAIQGASQPGKPVISRPTYQDVTWKGKVYKKGVQLWTVGTEIIKGMIYARLNLTEPGPGYMHFPAGIEDEYFQQLTGEKLVTRLQGFSRELSRGRTAVSCCNEKVRVSKWLNFNS